MAAALGLFWLSFPGPWNGSGSGHEPGGIDSAAPAEARERAAADPGLTGLPGQSAASGPGEPDDRARSAGRAAERLAGQPPGTDRVPAEFRAEQAAAEDPAAGSPHEEEPPGLTIAGAVLDDRGHLLPGITVTATPLALPGAGSVAAPSQSRVTDEFGMFRFDDVAEGEYDLAVPASATYREAFQRVRAGVESAELRLQRLRAVSVFGIVSGEGGVPLDSVRVRALGDSSGLMTDASGTYELALDLVKAGQPPVIEFTRTDYREKRERVEAALAAGNDAVRLDVQLEPSDAMVTLSGTVTGSAHEPVPGVKVWLSSANPRHYHQTVTGGTGQFHFPQVEIGDSYRAGVDPGPEYQPFVSEPFVVGPADTVRDMRLEEGGESRLSGRVVDPEGQPLAGITLWLRRSGAGGGAPQAFQTGADGRFIVEQVPSGDLRVESRSRPYLEASGIRLLPGESRDVLVPLDWGPHWLFGQVVDGSATPVAQAQVVLQWGQQFADVYSVSRREVSTDRLGYFSFSNLGAGDHVLTVMAPGYAVTRSVHDPRIAGENLQIALQGPLESTAGGGQ